MYYTHTLVVQFSKLLTYIISTVQIWTKWNMSDVTWNFLFVVFIIFELQT
jgi:hypothetical protein